MDTTAHLLGIVHEALGNIARHSGASGLDRRPADDGGLELTVTDNGRGFDPATAATIGHQGLVNMRERAEGIGATMTIDSARPPERRCVSACRHRGRPSLPGRAES